MKKHMDEKKVCYILHSMLLVFCRICHLVSAVTYLFEKGNKYSLMPRISKQNQGIIFTWSLNDNRIMIITSTAVENNINTNFLQ